MSLTNIGHHIGTPHLCCRDKTSYRKSLPTVSRITSVKPGATSIKD